MHCVKSNSPKNIIRTQKESMQTYPIYKEQKIYSMTASLKQLINKKGVNICRVSTCPSAQSTDYSCQIVTFENKNTIFNAQVSESLDMTEKLLTSA